MKHRFPTVILSLQILVAVALLCPIRVNSQPLRLSPPQLGRALNLSTAGELWAREWATTDTALMFPGGGEAGFYRRAIRMGRVVPHTGRQGILYLYPENQYRPIRMSRRHIAITPSNALLVVGASANRSPRGEWVLRVIVDGKQLGVDVVVSGEEGWQDIAFDLAAFLGRRVSIDVEAHSSNRNAAHVYIDYIHLEDPAERPVTSLSGPDTGRITSESPAGELDYFDEHYQRFIEILRELDQQRQQQMLDRREADRIYERP